MQSNCIREASKACFNTCCVNPLLPLPEPNTTSSTTRKDFVSAILSSIQPNSTFTNHESLPPLEELFSGLKNAVPQYSNTVLADNIRTQEYCHLSLHNHVCLDYVGHGLFSYSQKMGAETATSSSSSSEVSSSLFFDISYNSVSLNSHLLYGGQESKFQAAMRKRITKYMNVFEEDYSLVFTANQPSAFKLLADAYPFEANRNLLTVYDYDNEAVDAMIESAKKRRGRVQSALFSWPNFRVNSRKLRNIVVNKKKQKNRGLFAFPLQSRMTGSRYSYQWMNLARENGWHVLLDASALGEKDMETLGLSLFQPDFLICSFFKIFGDNPSGFCCLFIKKSVISDLNKSSTSMGIISLKPAKGPTPIHKSATDEAENRQQTPISSSKSAISHEIQEGHHPSSSEITEFIENQESENPKSHETERRGHESSTSMGTMTLTPSKQPNPIQKSTTDHHQQTPISSSKSTISHEIQEVHPPSSESSTESESHEPECRGLDHADALGLILISTRMRCLINWLINALLSLHHPHSEKGLALVRIYGPRMKLDRGPALAFNVFDWKGEKIEPGLVQKLADRNSVSLSVGLLKNVRLPENWKEEMREEGVLSEEKKKGGKIDLGIRVLSIAIGMVSDFEDVCRVWGFVARFLDADFVEKERWRYTALNQTTVEV